MKKLRAILHSFWNTAFIRDVLTLQIGSIFASGIGFLKSILFAYILGADNFGEYAVVISLTGTVGLVTNFGQNQAVFTFFAESYGEKNMKNMETIVKYFCILTVLAGIVYSILILLTPPLAQLLYESSERAPLIRMAFFALLIGTPHTIFITMLQTVREVRLMTILENINLLFQFLGAIALMLLGFGVMGIFTALFVSNTVMLIVYITTYFSLRRKYPLPALRRALQNRSSIVPFIKQGGWIAIDKNIGNLFPQGLLFIMGIMVPARYVGFAQLAFKIGSFPSTIFLPQVGRMSTTVLPNVRSKGVTALRQACVKILKHALAFHGLLSLGSLLVLPPLAYIFYGIEFSPMIPALMWIILIRMISALTVINSPLFRLSHKAHIPALWNAVTYPIVFVVFIWLLTWMDPLNAFVLGILLILGTGVYLSWYLYTSLLQEP
ncbi:hypothetical protein COU76_01950 [Candidatus Peregrinibacteria bacterium CG10_big_fil_rev_8_21_14_0_10_49_10]|nr:MAG: hypothetical protein COU76_01950 [Candidatus Peregrinibacteria bacterium CG10_big_fil_rev_8_21_14_0_10_49_10]